MRLSCLESNSQLPPRRIEEPISLTLLTVAVLAATAMVFGALSARYGGPLVDYLGKKAVVPTFFTGQAVMLVALACLIGRKPWKRDPVGNSIVDSENSISDSAPEIDFVQLLQRWAFEERADECVLRYSSEEIRIPVKGFACAPGQIVKIGPLLQYKITDKELLPMIPESYQRIWDHFKELLQDVEQP
ncbi:MAG: hypothetical protein S4CHLAM81_15140 [Chlamydiales bacterium]|nr:hypothetical protein [Chlamydiales bacterium]MCH9636283.1 hypothetical protein [Chlamydiales bacterium]